MIVIDALEDQHIGRRVRDHLGDRLGLWIAVEDIPKQQAGPLSGQLGVEGGDAKGVRKGRPGQKPAQQEGGNQASCSVSSASSLP